MPLAMLIAFALQAVPGADSELAEMRSAYAQDCLQRDYGSFDDICNQLADQISAYARSHPDASVSPRAVPRKVVRPSTVAPAPRSSTALPALALSQTPAPAPAIPSTDATP